MFSFDIDESWHAVQHILAANVGADCTRGVQKMRKLWERNKKSLYTQSGATGRLLLPVECKVYEGMYTQFTPGNFEAEQALLKAVPEHAKNVLHVLRGILFTCTVDEVANNRLNTDRVIWRCGATVMPAGMRLGKFVREYTIEYFKNTRDVDVIADAVAAAVSCATEVLRVPKQQYTAHVVLSVNPLDMLLASNCTTSWTSCHSLDGSYRTGPLSYMIDSCSAIAYAYNSYRKFNGFVLPRKMWRQMVYLDLKHGSALMSREYPTQRITMAFHARELVTRVLAEHNGVASDSFVHDFGYSYDSGGVWAYKDTPTACVRLKSSSAPKIIFGVGDVPCVVCGELRHDGLQAELECSSCGDYVGYTCVNCGVVMSAADDNLVFNNDSRSYCSECYNDLYYTCRHCGAEVFYADAREYEDHPYCYRCFDQLFITCANCGDDVFCDDVYEYEDSPYCLECYELATENIGA